MEDAGLKGKAQGTEGLSSEKQGLKCQAEDLELSGKPPKDF
jgi:hypothetical protein